MPTELAFEIETTTTLGKIDERVERARKQGYQSGFNAGFDAGVKSMKFDFDDAPAEINHVCGCGTEYFSTDEKAIENGWQIFPFDKELCPACAKPDDQPNFQKTLNPSKPSGCGNIKF
jgi:hypothetical protein